MKIFGFRFMIKGASLRNLLLKCCKMIGLCLSPSFLMRWVMHCGKRKFIKDLTVLWWRLISDVLPTRCRLARIFDLDGKTCMLFSNNCDGDLTHFFYCDFSIQIWRSFRWAPQLLAHNSNSITDWFWHIRTLKNQLFYEEANFLLSCSIVLDLIWKARNEKLHLETHLDPQNIIRAAPILIEEFRQATSSQFSQSFSRSSLEVVHDSYFYKNSWWSSSRNHCY